MVLSFRRAFRTNGVWVTERPIIVRHYLRGWFFFDLVAALPYELVAQPALVPAASRPGSTLRALQLLRDPFPRQVSREGLLSSLTRGGP